MQISPRGGCPKRAALAAGCGAFSWSHFTRFPGLAGPEKGGGEDINSSVLPRHPIQPPEVAGQPMLPAPTVPPFPSQDLRARRL